MSDIVSKDDKRSFLSDVMEVVCLPIEIDDDLKSYTKISLDSIASWGSFFAQFPEAFRTASSSISGGEFFDYEFC